VKTDVSTFIKGYNTDRIFMDPIAGNSNIIVPSVDVDKTKYNVMSPALNNFKFLICGSSNGEFMFSIGNNDRAYFWGYAGYLGASGIGAGPNMIGFQARPVPIATGIGDPRNPNPLY
jgi:hypothetical protein